MAIYNMKPQDIAEEIYTELGSPDDLSIPQIYYWLVSNIGQLNVLIEMEYKVEGDDFVPDMNNEEKDIFKSLYYIKWAGVGITSNLGAASYDWSEISEGDSTIRRVSKNEVAKNYKQLRDAYKTQLDELVYFYKKNKIRPDSYDQFFGFIA